MTAAMEGLVVGNYRVIRLLGQGGMGRVYMAEHLLLRRKVALKQLLPRYSADATLVDRFFKEALAAAQLRHPGIVDVFDYGHDKDGNGYLVMEFLEGKALGRLLSDRLHLDPGFAAEIIRQVAAAVGAAHEHGIIHRDLKPDNIFLSPDPELALGVRARVLDFGIAKLAVDTGRGTKTQTGAVFGTPPYMSPEQCRDSSHVDARSDLYSLGCIFFEMVCGRHPFKAPTIGELFAAHLRDPVPSPRSIDPRISPLYEGVILKLLAKSPEQRYQSAKQLVAELAGTKRTTARLQLDPEPDSEPVLPEAPLSTTLASTASEVTRAEGVGRRRTIVAAATLAAVVTLGVAWRTHQEPVAVVQVPEVASPPRPDPIVTKLIRRRFLTNPGGAQVVRRGDNSLVCITPCEESVAYGDDRRAFVLRLDGYKDESTVLSRYDDATVELQLQLLPASSGKSPVATPPAQGPRSPPPPADKRVKLPVLPEMKTPKTEATPSGAEEPPARSRAPAKGTEEDADGVVNPFRR